MHPVAPSVPMPMLEDRNCFCFFHEAIWQPLLYATAKDAPSVQCRGVPYLELRVQEGYIRLNSAVMPL